jgi:tripartite-type tricarboxylate transporter receptor subunit TctC
MQDAPDSGSKFTRRTALGGIAAAMVVPAATWAQAAPPAFKPVRPVRLISPLLAGGATDAIVRPIALKLADLWGQPVVVENRPGGGTLIGTQAVVTAPPDGHTFGVVISSFTINPSLRKDMPYDTFKDVTPLTQIGNITGVIVAHPSFPANTIPELIAQAKASPGTISYATLGVGTAAHIVSELLKQRAGINMVHVPYAGSSAAYRELLPGRVPVGFVVLESALPHIKAGKLKVLALTDIRRNKLHPEYPVLEETMAGLGYNSVFGLIGPRGLPPEIQQAMNADIVRVLADPAITQQLERQSMAIVASSPQEFAATIRREVDYWQQAVKASGASVN